MNLDAEIADFPGRLALPFEELSPQERNMIRGLRATNAGRYLIDCLHAMELQAYQLAIFHSAPTEVEFAGFQATGKTLAMVLELLEGEDEPEDEEVVDA